MTVFYSCVPKNADKTEMSKATTLPFGLYLDRDPDFKGGFTIRETDGFALIGKGVTYRDIDLQVNKLVGYGVQAEKLAAEVIDNQGNTKFITVVKAPSPNQQPFQVSWATASEVKGNSTYTWVDLAIDE